MRGAIWGGPELGERTVCVAPDHAAARAVAGAPELARSIGGRGDKLRLDRIPPRRIDHHRDRSRVGVNPYDATSATERNVPGAIGRRRGGTTATQQSALDPIRIPSRGVDPVELS